MIITPENPDIAVVVWKAEFKNQTKNCQIHLQKINITKNYKKNQRLLRRKLQKYLNVNEMDIVFFKDQLRILERSLIDRRIKQKFGQFKDSSKETQ